MTLFRPDDSESWVNTSRDRIYTDLDAPSPASETAPKQAPRAVQFKYFWERLSRLLGVR